MEFNEKLQELRKRKGLTQEELAEALFVSRTAVSKWESGRGYPGIDSLKAIAKFFAVTVDELLSGDEILTLAEEDNKRKEKRLQTTAFGLLDVSTLLLMFLPLFGQNADGVISEVPLIGLTEAAAYLRTVYFTFVAVTAVCGVLTLALQSFGNVYWEKHGGSVSLCLNAACVLVFTIGRQPYAAAIMFVFLTIKALIALKRR